MKIQVSVVDQSLEVIEDGRVVFEAPVSTAAKGVGFEEGSFQTPTGNFFVREKIGEGAPLGTVFRGRRPLGPPREGEGDPVTTRILWLDGLDAENANTYRRYIYFHGTPAAELVGRPASQGCVRLRDEDMVTLFEMIPLGTRVEIF